MHLLLGFLVLSFFVRLWLSSFGGIHPDEAYYWTWSLDPALGYFDHPPMIAWIIKLSRDFVSLFVSKVQIQSDPIFWAQISLRFIPYFLSCVVTPIILAKSIELVQRRPLRLTQTMIILSCPLLLLGPQVITPDTPFFAGWALCLMVNIYFLRSRTGNVFTNSPTPISWKLSILMAAALAFTAYSKFTAILAAFLFVICGSGLFNASIVGVLAFLLTLPHLWWNFSTGLESHAGVFFQLSHGINLNAFRHPEWRRVGDLLLAQIFIWTPILFFNVFFLPFVDIRRFFVRQQESRLTGSLFLWAAFPLIFFCLTGLHQKPEANWPLIGLLAGIVLVLSRLRHRMEVLIAMLALNLFSGFVFVMILANGPLLASWIEPIAPDHANRLRGPSRMNEFHNWDRLHSLILETVRFDKAPIEIQSYQGLSAIMFYDHYQNRDRRFNRALYIKEFGSRPSQFNLVEKYKRPDGLKNYWTVLVPSGEVPPDCEVKQSIYKNPEDTTPWLVARCGDEKNRIL